ncbi:UNVERIFIED_ORG: hypothetical protein ABIB13_003012 [Arthrobacter sp. UYEF2]
MPVDRGSRDLQEVCDALDCVISRVVELLRVVRLVRCEFGASAACSTAGAGGREAVPGVGDDEFSLEFSENGKHPEHRPPFRGRGVDALLEDTQSHTTFPEIRAEGDEVEYRPAESVEAGDDELITCPVG